MLPPLIQMGVGWMRQDAERRAVSDERDRFRDTARVVICVGLIVALAVIGFLAQRDAGADEVTDSLAYIEGGFRAVLAIGFAFAGYVGTRIGE
jgi:hypothetical protein